VEEHLPSKCKTLRSNPSTTEKKDDKRSYANQNTEKAGWKIIQKSSGLYIKNIIKSSDLFAT
jgi:hypothetical protein